MRRGSGIGLAFAILIALTAGMKIVAPPSERADVHALGWADGWFSLIRGD